MVKYRCLRIARLRILYDRIGRILLKEKHRNEMQMIWRNYSHKVK